MTIDVKDLKVGMKIKWKYQKCRAMSFESTGEILSIDLDKYPPLPPVLVSDDTGNVKEWRVFPVEIMEILNT